MSGRLAALAMAGAIGGGMALAEEIGDAERGAEIFDYCAGCHQLGKGAEHGIGPHLNGLFGRRGEHPTFQIVHDLVGHDQPNETSEDGKDHLLNDFPIFVEWNL